LTSYCLEFQVLTSQCGIQEIPFYDPILYFPLYIIVLTMDSGLLEWILLSLSYVRVILIFTAQIAMIYSLLYLSILSLILQNQG
jgi:hypothetical protein